MAAGSKIKRMDLAELEKNNRLNIRALRSIVAWHWLDGVLLADYTHPSLSTHQAPLKTMQFNPERLAVKKTTTSPES